MLPTLLWRAINWVIAGVNYISATNRVCFGAKKICKLAIYDDAYITIITPQFYQ